MTDVQKKLLELLTDLDALCKREGISYYLCGGTALSAFVGGSFLPNCCEANVAMTPDDAQKFIAAVEKENRADRITDSMCSNKFYPDFTVRYGDPNTLMMQLPYSPTAALPCMGVTIHMIRRKPKRLTGFYTYTKKFWKVACRPAFYYGRPLIRAAVTLCHVVKNVLGGKHFSRWLFNRWCDLFTSNKKAKKISICAGKFSFRSALIKGQTALMLEGQEFTTFSSAEDYLTELYGKDFADETPKYTKPSATLLVSATVPYQKYIERAKSEGLDFDEILRNRRLFDLQQGQVSKYNKKIDKYYAIVDRTQKRFAMYEMYMPMKAQLLQLHQEKKYDELTELLKPYCAALWDCYRKKLGLCFDKEIFDITMDVLAMEGDEDYVQKLRDMVPEEHWKPMVITDYKGEPIEC